MRAPEERRKKERHDREHAGVAHHTNHAELHVAGKSIGKNGSPIGCCGDGNDHRPAISVTV
jgi:hypothetical protein